MQTKASNAALFHLTVIVLLVVSVIGCSKDSSRESGPQPNARGSAGSPTVLSEAGTTKPNFNLEVILRGEGKRFGHVKFRQDSDSDHVITLEVWVRDLEPNHAYELQRAVDALDGNCTSTTWLTLGKGLVAQAIHTDDRGWGKEDLFRDVSAIPPGTGFDIHFQVVDATTKAVVLSSDCYQYFVR